jgi:SAM-dependent methyltransferase
LSAFQPLADFAERKESIAAKYCKDPIARKVFERTLSLIDMPKFEALKEKYRPQLEHFDTTMLYKYFDLPFWIANKSNFVVPMELHKGRALDILDIGSGAGHWAAVLKTLEHRVHGMDIAEPIYDDLCGLFGLERTIAPVKYRDPLPDFGRRFDMVTIFQQVFDIIGRDPDGGFVYWSLADWFYFLNDLAANHMQPNASLFIALNRQLRPEGNVLDPNLLPWAERFGAEITDNGRRILFRNIENRAGYFQDV